MVGQHGGNWELCTLERRDRLPYADQVGEH